MNLREYLKETNLITDGAFGTYFAAKYQTQEIPELANLSDPEKVKKGVSHKLEVTVTDQCGNMTRKEYKF